MSHDTSVTSGLVLDPEILEFFYDATGYYSNLIVSNPTPHAVAFKIKTTNRDRYMVRPNHGVIDANSDNLEIRIVVMGDALVTLQKELDEASEDIYACRDKFLVQTVILRDDEFDTIRGESTERTAQILTGLWANENKSRFGNHRMRCQYHLYDTESYAYPEGDAAVDGAPMPYDGDGGVDGVRGDPRMIDTPAGDLGGASAGRATDSIELNPAVVDGSSGGAGGAGGEFASGSPSGQASLSYQEMVDLRHKYNDLVTFTVKLTSQRDDLANRVEQQLKELSQLREEVETARDGSLGLRRRREDDAEEGKEDGDTSTPAKAPAADPALPPTIVKKGFSLPILLLFGIICFILGRLLPH